eukprot:TRINITY_DN80923_c0_g1_i1.p1 TRINITY_DN80923_c0_g1~~TRINITY_DN80923_c0_g1_i1.p1  ORF type:complete len:525 (-),score=136.20 TRINITY_DN80923_c0_g1_i1:420-1913(-)
MWWHVQGQWTMPAPCQPPMGDWQFSAPPFGGDACAPPVNMPVGQFPCFVQLQPMSPQQSQQGVVAASFGEVQHERARQSSSSPPQPKTAQKKTPRRQPDAQAGTSREKHNAAAEAARDMLKQQIDGILSCIKRDEKDEKDAGDTPTETAKELRQRWRKALQEAHRTLASECGGQETPEGRALPQLQDFMEEQEGQTLKVLGRHIQEIARVLLRCLRERVISKTVDELSKLRKLPQRDSSRRRLFLQHCALQIGKSPGPNLQSALLQAYHKRHGSSPEDHKKNFEQCRLHREPPLFTSKSYIGQQTKKQGQQQQQVQGKSRSSAAAGQQFEAESDAKKARLLRRAAVEERNMMAAAGSSDEDGEDCLPAREHMKEFQLPKKEADCSENKASDQGVARSLLVKNTFIHFPDADGANSWAPLRFAGEGCRQVAMKSQRPSDPIVEIRLQRDGDGSNKWAATYKTCDDQNQRHAFTAGECDSIRAAFAERLGFSDEQADFM